MQFGLFGYSLRKCQYMAAAGAGAENMAKVGAGAENKEFRLRNTGTVYITEVVCCWDLSRILSSLS